MTAYPRPIEQIAMTERLLPFSEIDQSLAGITPALGVPEIG
jgi:hypothetical protein